MSYSDRKAAQAFHVKQFRCPSQASSQKFSNRIDGGTFPVEHPLCLWLDLFHVEQVTTKIDRLKSST